MPGGNVGDGNYVVQPGDCMASIADAHGFRWQTLWDLPENAQLKSTRKDPYVLLPGDRVYIPELRIRNVPCATDQRHHFVREGTPSRLKIIVTDDEQGPLANQPYTLEIEGRSFSGTTDREGKVEHPIPPGARTGVLRIGKDENRREYFLNLGHVDPASDIRGLQARLLNLGFYEGTVDGELNPQTQTALLLFQQRHDLPPTGENDAATRAKLKELFGC